MPQLANSFTPASQQKPANNRSWPGFIVLALLMALFGFVVLQRQAVGDWIQLYGYEPPAKIAQLASQTTMTDEAKHLFYLNDPLVADKDTFSNYCTEQELTIVLGCYHAGQSGIYLLKIDANSELHGVMQVTAAHEVLHAAYDRLSDDEKQQVDSWLQDFYENTLKDKAIKEEIDSYRDTEPDQLVNEMHSIFGTEVAKLPSTLENYYAQFFSDRQAIIKETKKYKDAFRSRQSAVAAFDRRLKALKASINQGQAELTARGAQLQRDRTQLNAYSSSGNVSAYNAAVPAYNQAVREYNALLADVKADISDYNNIVEERNALVVEEQELVKQLSGSSLPSPQ